MRCLTWAWLLLLPAILGCNDNELGIHKRRPNRPPETTLLGGPADFTATPYVVRFFWSGVDADGTIDHFDLLLVDHPAPLSSLDGSDSLATVVVTVPAIDDPRWQGTAVTDSIFITRADSLLRDPQPGPGEDPRTIRDTPFERWHTLFVRAVDNQGLPDATPDYRTFNATNIAPTVFLGAPIRAGKPFSAPSTVVFNWDGEDPTGTGEVLQPVAARWVIIPSSVDWNGTYLSFPDSLYHLPKHGDRQYAWSPWAAWDATDGSGRLAVIRGLRERTTSPHVGFYIFAAQAMDEAGAVTPVFDWTTTGKNNVSLIVVSGRVGPILAVEDPLLGRFTFAEGTRPVRLDVAAGQPLSLCWSADASSYGGSITGYRYGWDIINLEDDREWTSWATTTRCQPTRTFHNGTHRFSLQVRDNAETVLQATVEFSVHNFTGAYDVLWVDDTAPFSVTSNQESTEDQLWIDSFEAMARRRGVRFDAARDVFDTRANALAPPSVRMLFDYKSVVWSVRASNLGTALGRLSRFVDPYDPDNINTARPYNYVRTYLRNGGKLWINGFRPANELWPTVRPPNYRLEAINIMTWDPGDKHPHVDSVGVTSLLYEMGIEMWDCGAGTGCLRSAREHLCLSVDRSTPPGSELSQYPTSTALHHAHRVTIPTADVDAAPAAGRTYMTSAAQDHHHSVALTHADLLELQSGNTVIKETSEDGAQLVEPHRHTVEIFDQLGLWGAPALAFGPRWDQAGPGSGQSNIEVYNMPGAMSVQIPPLAGRRDVIDLYRYRSPTPHSSSVFFPNTADNQPVFILAKHQDTDRLYSRAFMGFEAELLTREAHERLVDYIVWRQFRVDHGF